ncbi:MAG: hypothetical protein IJZ39_04465 [Oscillospiraceae bacterium]|nr:hypothetical protein [Oscillospiraceae bacterium]
MKSRTSLFNPAAFRKDVTRFAPAWVLYTVGLFMILTVVMVDTDHEYYRADQMAQSISFMAFINLCYGLLNGQLLFGDLFNARHCNALHAMPLRRECWFVTHTVSGLLFALVPNTLMMLVALPMLGAGWSVALWWYLAVMLQYLFFFGLAVCAALCVGNRFAMVLIYGIVNTFSLIVYWFYYTIYEPLLYGVCATEGPFLLWCPVWSMIQSGQDLVLVTRRTVEHVTHNEYLVQSVAPGISWWYLIVCAVLGVALLGTALLLYRRRKLESAGDFMAVRALEPVFLVLYTMCMAAGFQVFAELFSVNEYIFLALGLVIGFFTGRMLLMRTTKVFQPKGFLWFGVLAAAFILTLVLTALDPIGITRYVPDADDIKAVRLTDSYDPRSGDEPLLTEEGDLELVRQIHQLVLDGQIHSTRTDGSDYYSNLCLYYVLDNGVTVARKYEAAASSPAGQLAQQFYTRADFILGTDNVQEFAEKIEHVYYDGYKADGESTYGQIYMNYTNREYIEGLVEAILADCAEGNMAQNGHYHDGETTAWLEFALREPMSGYLGDAETGEWYNYIHITIYADSRHTVAYLKAHPFPVEEEVYG